MRWLLGFDLGELRLPPLIRHLVAALLSSRGPDDPTIANCLQETTNRFRSFIFHQRRFRASQDILQEIGIG